MLCFHRLLWCVLWTELVPVRSDWSKPFPSGSNWLQAAPVTSKWFIMVPVGFPLALTGYIRPVITDWCDPNVVFALTGSNWFPVVPAECCLLTYMTFDPWTLLALNSLLFSSSVLFFLRVCCFFPVAPVKVAPPTERAPSLLLRVNLTPVCVCVSTELFYWSLLMMLCYCEPY